MAIRYWKMGGSSGYAGTDWYECVDACKYLGYSEEELAEMSDEKIEEELADEAYRKVIEQCDGWAKPASEEEFRSR